MKVTVTKANYYRYEVDVPVTSSTYPYVTISGTLIDDNAGGNNDGIVNPGESINYGVSRTARSVVEENLIGEALAQFNRRAALVARQLGREGFKIVRLSINTPFNLGVPGLFGRNADTAVAMSVAQPELEAGTQQMTVSVNGTIELEAAP